MYYNSKIIEYRIICRNSYNIKYNTDTPLFLEVIKFIKEFIVSRRNDSTQNLLENRHSRFSQKLRE